MKIIAVPVDLLPCPFCGETPDIETWHGGKPTKHMVSCINNECTCGPQCTGETHALAVKNWNTRAAAPPQPEPSSCPCTIVEPCSYACSCAHPTMSGGCARCCSYGSLEQRTAAAIRIAGKLDQPVDHLADPDSRERAMNVAATQEIPDNSWVLKGAYAFARRLRGTEEKTNAAPERDAKPGIAEAGSRAAAPDGILCQARGDWGCNHTGTCASVNNAPPDAPAAAVSSAEAYAMDCEGYAVPAAPTTMNLGKRQESALPLSELVIESHRSYLLDRSLMLDSYIQSPYMQEVANKLCDQALHAIELGNDLIGMTKKAAIYHLKIYELERHLKAQAEWGVNQFDRAEKAEALVAEKDKEIALLLAESVLDKERTKKVEAEVAAARQRERERCAVVCEGTFSPMTSPTGCCDAALDKAAAAIRALTDD